MKKRRRKSRNLNVRIGKEEEEVKHNRTAHKIKRGKIDFFK
jgi:hypothetical protein